MDRSLRELERKAATGDEEAAARLARSLARTGGLFELAARRFVEVLTPEAALWIAGVRFWSVYPCDLALRALLIELGHARNEAMELASCDHLREHVVQRCRDRARRDGCESVGRRWEAERPSVWPGAARLHAAPSSVCSASSSRGSCHDPGGSRARGRAPSRASAAGRRSIQLEPNGTLAETIREELESSEAR